MQIQILISPKNELNLKNANFLVQCWSWHASISSIGPSATVQPSISKFSNRDSPISRHVTSLHESLLGRPRPLVAELLVERMEKLVPLWSLSNLASLSSHRIEFLSLRVRWRSRFLKEVDENEAQVLLEQEDKENDTNFGLAGARKKEEV